MMSQSAGLPAARLLALAAVATISTCPRCARASGQPPGRLIRRAPGHAFDALSLAEHEQGVIELQGVQPKNYKVTQLREVPHEGKPWTQGLEWSEGRLVETAGDYPRGVGSFVRILDPATGQTVQKVTDGLQSPMFIEGIARVAGRFYATTYMNKVALEFDNQFNIVKQHPYAFEGWGFTHSVDDSSFLATNGSEYVMTISKDTFRPTAAKAATCLGKTVAGLNELEMVDNFLGGGPALLGNVMGTRVVLVLDPATAACTGAFHLNDLGNVSPEEAMGFHVANGVAYNKDTDTFWVTGKNWASMFEIKISKDDTDGSSSGVKALDLLRQKLDR